ncbi:DUF4412 domain-containing protein [Polaribacter pectinis]|uniref:DUF4412 domain-containing protein n=1 Tax=Polaribacter pectinis TaxID=2738844 RepID=A0A7G9L9N1_9FLAO|nr:DUF4412 domain-containing protein [Polaribacter pectinis]QNM85330.1 DUF4412 domain-containing protein [Polaribacter pectinis]
MKLIKLLVLSILLLGTSTSVNAQFWKKLKKKAEEKISKIEDKVIDNLDKKTDKTINETIDGKKKEQTKLSAELPKFVGGSSVLMLMNDGYEYQTEDITVSVYGTFTKDNLSSSVKTYNEDKLIKPVDAYPKGFALAFNKNGFLNPEKGQIIIHHADSTKVVFSLKGTWGFGENKKPINASYVSLNVTKINDVRKTDYKRETRKNKQNSSANNENVKDLFKNSDNSSITIPDTFSFTSSLEMQMTSNGGNSANMEFLLGNYSDIYAMSISSKEMGENANVYNVITPKSITMFISAAGMKMKKTVPQEKYSQSDFSDKVPNNPDDLKKTGASKSIIGYTCFEYKYEKDGNSFTVWATKNFPMKGTNITMLGMHEGGVIDGFVLELSWKSGNETANMKAVKYNSNKNITINTTEYKSMGF